MRSGCGFEAEVARRRDGRDEHRGARVARRLGEGRAAPQRAAPHRCGGRRCGGRRCGGGWAGAIAAAEGIGHEARLLALR